MDTQDDKQIRKASFAVLRDWAGEKEQGADNEEEDSYTKIWESGESPTGYRLIYLVQVFTTERQKIQH